MKVENEPVYDLSVEELVDVRKDSSISQATQDKINEIEKMAHWAPHHKIKVIPSYGINHGTDEIPGVDRWLKRMYKLGKVLGEELGMTPEEYIDSAPKLEFNSLADLRNEEGIPVYVETRLPIGRLISRLELTPNYGIEPFLNQTSDRKPYIARMDGMKAEAVKFQEFRSQVRESGDGANLHEAVAFAYQQHRYGFLRGGVVAAMGAEKDGVIPCVGILKLFTVDAESETVHPSLWLLTSKRP